MATSINYSIGVSTAQGVQALGTLQNKLQQTSNAFAGLKNAVLGFATASFIGGLYKMANELTDMAAATGVSTQAILGFSGAVSANGGTMDGATKAIGKFVVAIDGAASGSKELQDTFLDLNISLGDLRKLSEEDLLKKTLEGLNNITDASKRVALGVKLFGKEFRSVDIKSVADQYDYFLKKAGLSAEAVQAAGDASQNFSNAFKTFSIQILAALEPISKLAVAILSMKGVIEPLITAVIGFGSAWLIFAKVIPFVKTGMAAIAISIAGSGGAIAALGTQLMGVQAGAMAFGRNMARAFGFLPTAYGGVASLTFAFSGLFRGLLRFAGIVGVFYTIFEIVSSLIKTITGSGLVEWGEKALKALGIISQTSAEKEKAAEANKKQANSQREVNDAMAKEKESLQAIIRAYRESNQQANKKFQLETDAISLSEAQALLAQEQFSSQSSYLQEMKKLQDQLNEKKISGSASDKAMIPVITAAMASLTSEYQKQIPAVTALVAARVKEMELDRFKLYATKNLIESQNKLQSIQDDIAKSTMTELEKKWYDIEAAATAAGKAAIEAEEAQRKTKLDPAERAKYYEVARQGNAELKAAAEAEYVNSRRFTTGWKNAFNEYVDNATNAAQQAQRIFQAATQGMEDLLMNFFKTGKFGWRDFVQNIIDVMMRSQVQQLIAKTFGGIGSVGGGGGGGRGGLFGGAIIPGFLADGGPAGAGKPYIVGERGPELFVPSTSGSVVPNGALGGSQVTYNINAVDALSFKQMIAADPTFLHAVAEQGRRRLPGAR